MRLLRCAWFACLIATLTGMALFGEEKERVAENKLPEKVSSLLREAKVIELYSVDPEELTLKEKVENKFQGFRFLGKTEITVEKTRVKLIKAIESGISQSNGKAALCFDPRHGIRARVGNRSVDMLICFECAQVDFWYTADGKEKNGKVLTARGPQATLDEILKTAGVPLPKPAKP